MEKKDSENLQHITDTLDEVLVVLKKPANKVVRVLEIVAAAVSAMGIISIIEKFIE